MRPKRPRRPKVPAGMFGSESELVQVLIDTARAAGYQAHPECSGWDVLVVCRETGDQIGVHGKLRPSVDVLNQALTDEHGPGPEVHVVLVPVATRAFLAVAGRLGIHVIQGVHLDRLDLADVFKRAQRWHHPVREWAPEVEMSFPAGVPAPRKMTPWKMSAVKLCLLARKKGFVTRADMKLLKLNPHWWLSKKFGQVLEPLLADDGAVRSGEYRLRDSSSPMVPDLRWPEITEALEVQAAKAAAALDAAAAAQPPVLKGPRMRMRKAPPRPQTMLPPATVGNKQYFDEGIRVASGK